MAIFYLVTSKFLIYLELDLKMDSQWNILQYSNIVADDDHDY